MHEVYRAYRIVNAIKLSKVFFKSLLSSPPPPKIVLSRCLVPQSEITSSWFSNHMPEPTVNHSFIQSNLCNSAVGIMLCYIMLCYMAICKAPLSLSQKAIQRCSQHDRLVKIKVFLSYILSRFHSCTSTRPPSSPTATIAPCCLLGLTFPDFDLAPKQNEKFGYCGLDLV